MLKNNIESVFTILALLLFLGKKKSEAIYLKGDRPVKLELVLAYGL